jgi:SNF2 family DNA or RNA helicase
VLNWLYPYKYTSYWKFAKTYVESEKLETADGHSYTKIMGVNRAALPQLKAEMAPFYVRKLKSEVLSDLPDKLDPVVRYVDLTPAQRKSYNEMRGQMLTWIKETRTQQPNTPLAAPIALSQLQRLQQFAMAHASVEYKKVWDPKANQGKGDWVVKPFVTLIEPSSKLDAVMEILDDTDEPIVVFSQSRQIIELLGRRLSKANISHALFTGGTSAAERGDIIRRFQSGDYRVFAGTIRAGGEGITLHRSSTVVFIDRAWSPAKNRQAEDRLHRIGQKNPVQVIDIVARNTIDTKRNQDIQRKWEWLEMILGDK